MCVEVSLLLSCMLSPKTESLIEPRCTTDPQARLTGGHGHALPLMWVLGIQTQDLMFEQCVLLPTKPSPNPFLSYFW